MLDQKALAAIRNEMREELTNSENLVLEELDRVQEGLTRKVEKVQKNLEDLQQYYRITKLENDNTSLLLQMIVDLRKDVEELKNKTA